jgi:hypothetical protein
MFERPNCPDDAATMNPAGLDIAGGDNNPSKSEAFHLPSPRRDGPARVHTTDETGSTAIQQPFAQSLATRQVPGGTSPNRSILLPHITHSGFDPARTLDAPPFHRARPLHANRGETAHGLVAASEGEAKLPDRGA